MSQQGLYPPKKEFLKQAEKFEALPISLSLLTDYDTPLSLLKKLGGNILLESVHKGETVGRHSIITLGARAKLSLENRQIRGYEDIQLASGKTKRLAFHLDFSQHNFHPLQFVGQYFLRYRVAENERLPPFFAGAIGYLGYEVVQYFEKIPAVKKDKLQLPDGLLLFPLVVAVYDNLSRELQLISTVLSGQPKSALQLFHDMVHGISKNPAQSSQSSQSALAPKFSNTLLANLYDGEVARLHALAAKIAMPLELPYQQGQAASHARRSSSSNSNSNSNSNSTQQTALAKELSRLTKQQEQSKNSEESTKSPSAVPFFDSSISYPDYKKIVEQARSYIYQGEIIQVVLSQRFSLKTALHGLELYRSLKILNPSPFLYYMDFDDFQLAGSSPEVMVRLHQDELLLRPIAGSAPRGKNIAEDESYAKAMLSDPKECAEHVMLVDLGRNDLSRVARTGTVHVEDFMKVEKYSSIQHIVSTITAEKKPDLNAIDVIAATFPAGTLSGAPKVRAMEIISELESEKRGPYGGMVLNLSLNGNLDSCIFIRSFCLKNEELSLQVGSGIVFDSNPEYEYTECLNKSKALRSAYEHALLREAPKKTNT